MTEVSPQELSIVLPDDLSELVPEASEEVTRAAVSWTHYIKRGIQTSLTVAEISPLNEVARASVFVGGEALSHNPVMGALTLGLSTLAIEGAGALAAADLVASKTNQQFNQSVKDKLEKIGFNSDKQLSRFSKTAWTFVGGSVVGMTLEQFDSPDMTAEQQRVFGLKSAVWLAGICAVAGAAGDEAVDYTIHNPMVGAAVAGSAGVVAVGRKAASTMTRRAELRQLVAESGPTEWLDHDRRGLEYGIIRDAERLQKAAELEQAVWDEKGYGNLSEEGYDQYIANSTTYAAFDKAGNCLGMDRMFRAVDGMVPPFLAEDMPYYAETERQAIIDLANEGLVEELGTLAVDPSARNKDVNQRLYRLSYRDLINRGVEYCGIIMEPERVDKLRQQGFVFTQLGPAVDYQGGACAAHIMHIPTFVNSLRKEHPLQHYWFVTRKIRP